jgi:hypothetical protein
MEDSLRIDKEILTMLQANSIPYHTVKVDADSIKKIIGLLK